MASPNNNLLFALCFMVGLALTLARPVSQNSPQDYVDAHNAIRAENGVGPISWNTTIAAYAQKYAETKIETCEMEHSMGPYAESLAMVFEDTTAEFTVKYWATEKEFYDPKENKCVKDECGHFMNIVGKDTTSIGCADVKCKNNYTFVICDYY